jgi:hypothetical protein
LSLSDWLAGQKRRHKETLGAKALKKFGEQASGISAIILSTYL